MRNEDYYRPTSKIQILIDVMFTSVVMLVMLPLLFLIYCIEKMEIRRFYEKEYIPK
jgi:lipopolysaccharide/colanic/teichoic acid biosynthesis glycosyltransferase